MPKAKDKINISKFKKSILKTYIIGKSAKVFIKQIKDNLKFSVNFSMKNALLSALNEAKKYPNLKQVILLSPSAASFDQYKNFEHRGFDFKNLVKKYS